MGMTLILVLITLFSACVALAMSVVAWRAVRGERLRSEARVAALAAELEDVSAPSLEFDIPVGPTSGSAISLMSGAPLLADVPEPVAVLQSSEMFATEQVLETRSRMPIALLAGATIVGTAIVAVVLVSTIERPSASPAPVDTTSQVTPPIQPTLPEPTPAAPGTTVELVKLGHHRDNDRLIVEGVVRNPANGSWVHHLTAVVLMFNSSGALVATERSPVESSDLEPGAASQFAVSVPGSEIVRYRISFRTDERVVPHVDKRNDL
jgi:hypothetical protein